MTVIARHAGRWTLEDRFSSPWHYLPVEVPTGCHGLRVELCYDRGAATLDLGCLGPAGFRGWSGGARRSFVIGPERATPGYLAGEPEPGLWQVIIGIYRLPADGVAYEVTAHAASRPGVLHPGPEPGPPAPPASRPARRELPASAGRRWLAGDLHTHTVHSDGSATVPELACLAAGQGLDFLAITDHNTVSHHAELPGATARYGVTLLPGQEVTTDTGHANVLGDVGWVDFRRSPDDWLAHTQRHGGLMSVNHPIAGHVSWMHTMTQRPPLLEVWHWSWLDPRWTTPLSWWQLWDAAAIPVGGSDWHSPGANTRIGTPTTWVESEGSEPGDVLRGLAAGRVAVSASRGGPVLLRRDGDLVAVDADGTILAGPDGPRARVSGSPAVFGGRPGAHRLTDASGGTLALTG
jgi:PHP domain